MTDKTFTVFHNGMLTDETHLTASGNPAPAPEPTQSEDWQLCEGNEQSGIEVRWHKNVKQYRAVVRILDDRYEGKKEDYSAIFKACDAADAAPLTGYTINPQQERHQRDIAAAVIRSHMTKDMAAMSDMRLRLRDLEFQVMRPYTVWMRRRERHDAQMQRTATIRSEVAQMLSDIREFGMQPEYEQFGSDIAELQTLLGKGTQ